jgi:hypothetical protein
MNQYQIAIVVALMAQAVTLFLLWMTHRDRQIWQAMWMRDTSELLFWKRNGILRDPLTGKYRKRERN